MHQKKLVLSLVLIILLVGMTGCVPQQDKSEQFTEGLADLVLMPLSDATTFSAYQGTMVGEVSELMNSRSHETETEIILTDLSSSMDIGFDLSSVEDSRLEIDTAYQMDTGDGIVEFYGLGVVNSSMAVHENMIALDLPALLMELMGIDQTLYIADFESGLDFTQPIPLADRINDLNIAVNGPGKDTEQMLSDLADIVDRYKSLLSSLIDSDQIEASTEEMEIAGELRNVQVLSLTLDAESAVQIITAVLEQAKTDEELFNFFLSFQSDYTEFLLMEEEGSLHEDFVSGIQDMIDSLPTDFEDLQDVAIKMDLCFMYEGFLSKQVQGLPWVQTKTPVALRFSYSDADSGLAGLYTSVKGDDTFDLTFTLEAHDEMQSFNGDLYFGRNHDDLAIIVNFEDSSEDQFRMDVSQFFMDGNKTITGTIYFGSTFMDFDLTLNGLTETSGDTETTTLTYYGTIDDGWSETTFDLNVTSDLERVQSNSEYERNARADIIMSSQGETYTVGLDVDTTWNFSDDIEVDVSMFEDPDAAHFDSIMEMLEELVTTSSYY